MPHRRAPTAGLLAFLLAAAPAATASAEALRDAATTVILLRQSRSQDGGESALSRAFDAAPLRRSGAPAARGRYRRARNWFPPGSEEELRDAPHGMPRLELAPQDPAWRANLSGAVAAAFSPWRNLLAYAWGGSWTGETLLKNWTQG